MAIEDALRVYYCCEEAMGRATVWEVDIKSRLSLGLNSIRSLSVLLCGTCGRNGPVSLGAM